MPKLKRIAHGTRVANNVSRDYAGALYYRRIIDVSHHIASERFDYKTYDADRWQRYFSFHRSMPPKLGTMLDDAGVLMPEWRVPLKLRIKFDGPLPMEIQPGSWVSDRARAVIDELEPDRHIYTPIDGIRPDGSVERLWNMEWGQNFLPMDPPPLNPELNDLIRTPPNAEPFVKFPMWMVGDRGEHFGYLNAHVVTGLHLFSSHLLDNQVVLSATLFERLLELGPIGPRWDIFSPMGVA